eukprot:gene22834-biopygen16289
MVPGTLRPVGAGLPTGSRSPVSPATSRCSWWAGHGRVRLWKGRIANNSKDALGHARPGTNSDWPALVIPGAPGGPTPPPPPHDFRRVQYTQTMPAMRRAMGSIVLHQHAAGSTGPCCGAARQGGTGHARATPAPPHAKKNAYSPRHARASAQTAARAGRAPARGAAARAARTAATSSDPAPPAAGGGGRAGREGSPEARGGGAGPSPRSPARCHRRIGHGDDDPARDGMDDRFWKDRIPVSPKRWAAARPARHAGVGSRVGGTTVQCRCGVGAISVQYRCDVGGMQVLCRCCVGARLYVGAFDPRLWEILLLFSFLGK